MPSARDIPQRPLTATHIKSVPVTRWAIWWRLGKAVLQVGIPVLVVWLIWHELHAIDIHDVRSAIGDAPRQPIVLGVLTAFLAVAVMGLYDAVAFPRGKDGSLNFRSRWLLGSLLFAWTNFISMGPIGGPALRLIAYRKYGLSGTEITRGLVGHYIGSSGGFAAWFLAVWLPGPSGITGSVLRVLVALVASVSLPMIAGRVLVPLFKRRRYGAGIDNIPLGRLGLIAFFDWGLTLLSFTLLTGAVGAGIAFDPAARTMFTGHFAGIVSMIPGGLGTADAVWFKGFALSGVSHKTAGAAVLVYRAGFYLLPWAFALIIIYIIAARCSGPIRLWQRRIIAGSVMINAILLLLSAAAPALRDRLNAVEKIVPLGAIEVSHALATVAAGLMLFLVRGLLRGYRGAYVITLALLAASAIANPLKGGDYEEAVVSVVLIVMLFGVRDAFIRKGRIPVGWEVVLAAGVGASALFLVSGFTAFERIPQRTELWTAFAERAEASRFLRAAVILVLIGLMAAVRQAVRPENLRVKPSPEDIARAETFAKAHADSADTLLVGGGDKGVWFHEDHPGTTAGMVLYQRRGDRIIVFRDPVITPETDPAKVIDAFLRFAEGLDVEPIFSGISPEWMSRLHDFGFHFLKMNEEAIVPLLGFTLEGGKNSGFRRTLRDMDKAGVTYEVIDPSFDSEMIQKLRSISDAWLNAKGAHELQFTACCFSPAYLQRNPIAIARDKAGEIIAFVNILATRPGGPVTLDFMRYIPGRVDNLMDFLIIRTMQMLAEQGHTSFSLGAAPLSEVGVRRKSRLIERLMHIFSTKAERLYNYEGLLTFKNKFHPEWEPRYLAYQHPWDWAGALVASTRLVQARSRADRARIATARVGAEP